MQEEWISPDDKIYKKLLQPGVWDRKPYESSIVKLSITDSSEELLAFNDIPLVIGDIDGGELGRMLDICISTMHLHEKAFFTITIGLEQVSATIELCELEFKGFIFQWDAQRKCDLVLKHKEKGALFFKEKNQLEAAYRFTKALKILCSIPIDVQCIPKVIDGVKLDYIKDLKEKLFNNLASCYFRERQHDLVIPLCKKVLEFDQNNVKALYKIGVSYESDRNFEKAHENLSKLLEIEPHNKACAEHLANVNVNLKKANIKVNDMMKKMITGSLSK